MSEVEKMDDMQALEPIQSTPVAPATGIAALALNFALKYHGINTVQDGALYQQYKLEGKNMMSLHLDMVFDTAIQMERHLMAGSQRIADIVVEALGAGVAEANETGEAESADNTIHEPGK